jgi:hypothetical protein
MTFNANVETAWEAYFDFNTASPCLLGATDDERLERLRGTLQARAPELVRELFPCARFGREEARVGSLSGEAGESLAIQLVGERAGQWIDHANPADDKGDLITLWMELEGRTFTEAVDDLERWCGITPGPKWETRVSKRAGVRAKEHAARPAEAQEGRWVTTKIYRYLSEDGIALAFVHRQEHTHRRRDDGKPEKKFLQQRPDGSWAQPEGLRPLYRLPEIKDSKVVVLVEGEKCADALAERCGVPATTAMGGAGPAPEKTDWRPLAGKRVIIWPDNDEAGLTLPSRVRPLLEQLGCEVWEVPIPTGKPAKWDSADAIEEGDCIDEILEAARPEQGSERQATASEMVEASSRSITHGCGPSAPAFDPWERYLVPPFPLETLPPILREFVVYVATSTGGDPAAVAMAVLTACSGALDQRFRLKMKRTGDWCVPPRLWTMLVGDPSTKKTPIMSAAVKPLRIQEAEAIEDYRAKLAAWAKLDKDERGDPPDKPPRLLFNDITSEKVGDVLSKQDRGALVENDELSGWIGAMDKYSGGKGSAADRSFWAQAYNGGAKQIDRLNRGEIYVRNLCVAFLAAMQPDRLGEISGLSSDGLMQRFVPVMMRRASYPQEVDSEEAPERYNELISYLLSMRPHNFLMDEGGRAAADEFHRYIFELENTDGLGKNFCSFAGKLTGLLGALSLVLHLADNPREADTEPVSERTVRAAIRILREFVIPHALVFYQSATDKGNWEDLRTIASFLLTSDRDRLTPSDFTSKIRPLKGVGLWELGQRLSPLVAGGWLEEERSGAQIKAWNVRPGVREFFSQRRDRELERKAELADLFRSLRTQPGHN